MLLLYVSVFLASINLIVGQSCKTKESCEECIQEFECTWCTTLTDPNEPHCRMKNESNPTSKCREFMDLTHEDPVTEENFDFSNSTEHPLQVKPQKIKLTLRRGEKVNINFQYKSTANFPVDLYYLMDLSNSMKYHKQKLGDLGQKLAQTMRNITTNFRLGFGSFIDKVDLPFVNTVKEKLASPCPSGENCVSPYSFKNHLVLTDDATEFVKQVRAAQVSGNLDAPEGGLDAMMQAIVCQKKIGWRKNARHLLVFSTDAEFHIAGDGKLAGVIEPNKATCYSSDQEYLIYDYPSISHINYVAQEYKINIIFAIVRKKNTELSESYRRLSQAIENSNFGELDQDANNIVSLVVENYQKIVQTIKFTSNTTKDVDIKFTSTCNKNADGSCYVHVNDVLDFTATIEPKNCPRDRKKIISLHPEALDQSLIIELDILCDCPCSQRNHSSYVPNSDQCGSEGDLKCGKCDCFPGRFGSECQCDTPYGKSENVTNCKMKKDDVEECSGNGQCSCEKCVCDKNFFGQWCECDRKYCMKNGEICSKHGTCECNKCKCDDDYKGKFCDCTKNEKTCIAPGSDKVCSGNGECLCGHCECRRDGKVQYAGTYCEDCTSCPPERCPEFRDCVECLAYEDAKYSKEECNAKCNFTVTIVHKLSEDKDEIKKCVQPDKDKRCKISFEYYYDQNGEVAIRALDKKICPPPPNILAWILAVTGSIVLAGIIMLLVWKIYTSVHDKREYAKFEQERRGVKWHRNDNPLYKEATSKFDNPAYKRSSMRNSQ